MAKQENTLLRQDMYKEIDRWFYDGGEDWNRMHEYVDMLGKFPQSLWVCRDIYIKRSSMDAPCGEDDILVPAGSMIYWYLCQADCRNPEGTRCNVMVVSPMPQKKITILCVHEFLEYVYSLYNRGALIDYPQLLSRVLDEDYEITYIDSCSSNTKEMHGERDHAGDTPATYQYAAEFRDRNGKVFVLRGSTPVDVVRAAPDIGVQSFNLGLNSRLAGLADAEEVPDQPRKIIDCTDPEHCDTRIESLFDIVAGSSTYTTASGNTYREVNEQNGSDSNTPAATHRIYKDYWYSAPGIRIRHASKVEYADGKLHLDEYVFDPDKDLNSTYYVDRNEAMKHFM